jgi:hypothetical protein
MPAYLVPTSRAPRPHPCHPNGSSAPALCAAYARRPPTDAPYALLGRIRYAPPFNGRLRFRVPRLTPRSYAFVVYCAPCYKGPGGSLIRTGPTFLVTR